MERRSLIVQNQSHTSGCESGQGFFRYLCGAQSCRILPGLFDYQRPHITPCRVATVDTLVLDDVFDADEARCRAPVDCEFDFMVAVDLFPVAVEGRAH